MTKLSGVYEIKNIKDGNIYIGSSNDVNERMCKHLNMLKNKKHHSAHLQRAWNKYGESNFVMRPLLYCDRELTLVYEQACLDKLKPAYNVARCAEASARGMKRSDETRKKISFTQKGRTVSKESIQRRTETRAGYSHTEETKSKISNSIFVWHETEQGKRATRAAVESHKRSVVCLNNGVVYESIKDAENELGVDHSKISAVAKGKRNHSKGFRFAYMDGSL